jgi:Ni/Co efflux regulator RcnB
MQHQSRLTAAALAGLVTVGALAATVATVAPASAADHRGNWSDRDRGHVDVRRDWHRDERSAPVYNYPQRAYVYAQPVYPAYPYPYYNQPSNGYVHVNGPGWGVGFSL